MRKLHLLALAVASLVAIVVAVGILSPKAEAQNRVGRDTIFEQNVSADINAGALSFTTDTKVEWRLLNVSIHFTTAVARNITISQVNGGTNSFVYRSFPADNSTDILITDAVGNNETDEIKVEIDQAGGGGIVTVHIVGERI